MTHHSLGQAVVSAVRGWVARRRQGARIAMTGVLVVGLAWSSVMGAKTSVAIETTSVPKFLLNQTNSYKLSIVAANLKTIPEGLQSAFENALSNWNGLAPFENTFELVSLRQETTWGLATLRPKQAPSVSFDPNLETIDVGNLFSAVFVITNSLFSAAIQDTPEVNSILAHISKSDFSNEARSAIFRVGHAKPDVGTQNIQNYSYKLPWKAGDGWVLTQGWHGDKAVYGFPAYHSLDIGRNGDPDHQAVLSAASGTISQICRGGSGWLIKITTTGLNESLGYLHIDARSIPSGISEGLSVQQGQLLGYTRPAYSYDGCGVSGGVHLHLFFPYKPLTLDGYEFSDANVHWGESLNSTQGVTLPPDPPGTVTVDESSSGFTTNGTWTPAASWVAGKECAYGGTARWTRNAISPDEYAATWRPALTQSGRYQVIVKIPGVLTNIPDTDHARYIVHDRTGDKPIVEVRQNNNYCTDILLGEYEFEAGNSGYVYLGDSTGETPKLSHSIIADQVKFVRVGDLPVTYAAQYVAQNYNGSMIVGTVQDVSLEVRNTGSATWDSNTRLSARNPTSDPSNPDAPHPMCDTTWLSGCNRIVAAGGVAPNQTKVFNFKVRAPNTPGPFRINFGLVQEGVRWFDAPMNGQVFFDFNVIPVPPDTTPPTGSITSPPNNSTTDNPIFTITADASDEAGGSGVFAVSFDVEYNGTWHGIDADLSKPYSVVWNAAAANVPDQVLRFRISVYDDANNVTEVAGGYRTVTLKRATPITYTVGQGSSRAQMFIEAYTRNGGAAKMGAPTGAVYSWLRPGAARAVKRQDFSGGPIGFYSIIHDESLDTPDNTVKAFVLHGSVGSTFLNTVNDNTAVAALTAPTSDEYQTNTGWAQNFANGRYVWNGGANGTAEPWVEAQPNWKEEYWNNKALTGGRAWVGTLSTDGISISWGPLAPRINGSKFGILPNDFSTRWTRTVYFPAGTYRFYAYADDGKRLKIDGQIVIDKFTNNTLDEDTYEKTFPTSGNHVIVFEYFQYINDAEASLRWHNITTPVPTTPVPTTPVPTTPVPTTPVPTTPVPTTPVPTTPVPTTPVPTTPVPTTPVPTTVSACSISLAEARDFVNTRNVTVRSNVSNAAQIGLSNDGGDAGIVWQAYAPVVNWTLSDTGGRIATLLTYALFRDANGNLLCNGVKAIDNVGYDPIKPRVKIKSLVFGAMQANLPEAARLEIEASDPGGGSGVVSMTISTDPNFIGAGWQPFTTTVSLNLPAGKPMVYVKVLDGAGNGSETADSASTHVFLPMITR